MAASLDELQGNPDPMRPMHVLDCKKYLRGRSATFAAPEVRLRARLNMIQLGYDALKYEETGEEEKLDGDIALAVAFKKALYPEIERVIGSVSKELGSLNEKKSKEATQLFRYLWDLWFLIYPYMVSEKVIGFYNDERGQDGGSGGGGETGPEPGGTRKD